VQGEVYVNHRRTIAGTAITALLLLLTTPLRAQTTPTTPSPTATTTPTTPPPATPQGGTIKGTILAGTPGKPGGIPLPGVAITATNTITGKKYTAATDIDGAYEMKIPRNGRYVVKAELAGFVATTQEVVLTGVEAQAAANNITITPKATDFAMELASRAAADAARQTAATTSLTRGLQGLNLTAGGLDADAASTGTGNSGTNMPTLGNLSDSVTGAAAASAGDAITVNGQQGQTNGLANFSEDEIRSRIEDAVAQGRASGLIPQGGDLTSLAASVMGGMMVMSGPGGGGPGGGGGGGGFTIAIGGGGGGGGRGGGSGAFRNFNPAQPHGAIFYQGGNAALNASTWLVSNATQPHFTANPAAYSNRFGVSIATSPYIPGLTKPNTKQFVFINITGQKNLNAFAPNPVRVATAAERSGDFSHSFERGSGSTEIPVTLYDPTTGLPFGCSAGQTNCATNIIPAIRISQQALNLLNQNIYPLPNLTTTDPTANNYQTISNAGSNSIILNARYNRSFGGGTQTPFGNFGGGGGGGGRRGGGNGGNANTPPVLRQSMNLGYNYSHSAQDNRNIFLPLGGANFSNGYQVNAGYVVSYGRLSNNASINWNRSSAETRNYFTDTANNPALTAGICVPNGGTQSCGAATGFFGDPNFYNGLPSLNFSNVQGLSNQTPSQSINQTISFSDSVAWRHKKHNMRYGFDIRRVHADSIGGNNALGSLSFTGYATSAPTDQVAGLGGVASGYGFADFLLGLPQTSSIQAGLYKDYLRENVYDWYVTDDYRVSGNWTLNYGLRYEYFGPYTEKNGRLINLTNTTNVTAASTIGCTSPNAVTDGTVVCAPSGRSSLINPDRTMYAPRLGIAYRPRFSNGLMAKLTKNMAVRAGYGTNFNTGQYATFAKLLSHQEPFSTTQNNTVLAPTVSNTTPADTGCHTTQKGGTFTPAGSAISVTRQTTNANATLAHPFSCSTLESLQNNWAVDPNYRLGMVQVYNLNIQKTLPLNTVLNLGYAGSKGSGLDVVGTPNGSPSGTITTGVAPFDYEFSQAGSHSNQLIVSLQKRQQKGIAVGATYTYSHTIDNASGVSGAVGSPVQNIHRLDQEEGNSTFDQRHNLSGNFLAELPFGPNRAFLNKGGFFAHALDNFSVSGNFTFASGTYFTPGYSANQAESAAAGTFNQRPNRDLTQPIKGAGKLGQFFNTAAFTAPASGQYGTASPGSIEGPGTVSVSASLARTIPLGDTRSFEARVSANNVFNTVQYSGINTTQNSITFGQVTSAAAMRTLQVQARYRF
jgi:hypothetical protein